MGRIKYIDGLRAVSVLMVIISHVSTLSSIASKGWGAILFPYGGLGVQIFFVISGFVICRSLLTERREVGTVSLAAFFIRRLFRIMPPLLMYVAAIATLAAWGILPAEAAEVNRSLVFVCNLPPPISPYCGGSVGAHLWSLSFEEQFYLVFPFAFLVLTRPMSWAILTLPLIAVAAKLSGLSSMGDYLYPMSFIAFGVFAAYHQERVTKLCVIMPVWSICALIAAAFLLPNIRGSAVGSGLNFLLMPPMLVLAIFGVARLPALKASLEARPLVAVGAASYGIYLWQQLATFAFPGTSYVFYAASIAGCVAGALVMFRFVEKPLVQYGNALSRRMQDRSACSVSGLAVTPSE